ncbi:transcription factor GTE1-like, partial [Trifolium medium]|nr:transcription factor GTE1-like [Trifolium medium]
LEKQVNRRNAKRGRPTGSKKPLKRASEEMQKEITRRKCAWPFMAPVDVKGLELDDYYQIIEKPMDLGTVRKKLKESGYKNARQMYEDVKLTFKNAMKYNRKETDIHVTAKTLLDKFEEKWQNLLPEVEKAESQLLKEESHERSYKTLVPGATYAKMARGLSTEVSSLLFLQSCV